MADRRFFPGIGPLLTWAFAQGIGMVVFSGCNGDTEPKEYQAACCVADPVPHGVTLLNCQDDAMCPSGTACIDVSNLDSDSDWPRADDEAGEPTRCRGTRGDKVCGIPETRSGARQALTQGFHVQAFRLEPVTDDRFKDRPAFTWHAPKGTRIVHCALFACRPAIREARDGLEIANYDSCVLASELYEPGSGIFDLTNPDLEYRPVTEKVAGCFPVKQRRISELAVGCWAYDTTHLFAATPLEIIDGRGLYNYQQAFVEDCVLEQPPDGGKSEDKEAKACFVDGTDVIGACHDGACLNICVDNSDCAPSDVVGGSEQEPDAAVDVADGTDAMDGGATGADAGPKPLSVCVKDHDYIGFCMPAEGSEVRP
ncbi:MAG: hypothetical protein PHU25_07045 [Deltaproteobacteria bacterium]|nr:hypothetical protein [Deltaproteobacteria bacterium]